MLNEKQTAILDKISSHIRLYSKTGSAITSGKGKPSTKKGLVRKPANPKGKEAISKIH